MLQRDHGGLRRLGCQTLASRVRRCGRAMRVPGLLPDRALGFGQPLAVQGSDLTLGTCPRNRLVQALRPQWQGCLLNECKRAEGVLTAAIIEWRMGARSARLLWRALSP